MGIFLLTCLCIVEDPIVITVYMVATWSFIRYQLKLVINVIMCFTNNDQLKLVINIIMCFTNNEKNKVKKKVL